MLTNKKILEFRGEYFFLSNFYPCKVTYWGVTYPSSEHAYIAMKSTDPDYRKKILACSTPNQAKRLGRKVKLIEHWDGIKYNIMHEIVFEKFQQNLDLKEKLLLTGDLLLEEGNTWNDRYWGIDLKTGKGKNNLGIILMKVRDELCKGNALQYFEDHKQKEQFIITQRLA